MSTNECEATSPSWGAPTSRVSKVTIGDATDKSLQDADEKGAIARADVVQTVASVATNRALADVIAAVRMVDSPVRLVN